MIVLSPHAAEIERQEREAERTRLIERALEYSARIREEERLRIMRRPIRIDPDVTVRLQGSQPHRRSAASPTPAPEAPKTTPALRRGGLGAKKHTVDGVSQTMAAWAAERGITESGLYQLIRRHGTLEAALRVRRNRRRCPNAIDTGGGEELASIDVGTGGGRTAQETPESEFSENKEF